MPRDFYPRPEAKIVAFTANLSQKLNSDPSLYGIPAEQASAYAELTRVFTALYRECNNSGGDSSTNYVAKETARVALEKATRPIVGTIKANRSVSDAMRVELGLGARPVRRRRIGQPESAPRVRVLDMGINTVKIRLEDSEVMRAGKPRDVSGALIWMCAGENPPADKREWNFVGATSRVVTDMNFKQAIPPGTRVWIAAAWSNSRQETGPWSNPVFAYVPFGRVAVPGSMRNAA